jgi:GT2 family glycosyltransferase
VQVAITELEAEIIVIDNNSPDDSCAMVKQLFPEVVLIENKENLGFSKANNQGVKIAKGEYVCILNPDTVVAEDTFTQLLEFVDSKDNLGIVGCRLIDGAGNFLPESKRNIPMVKVAVQKLFGNSENYYANRLTEDDVAKVDILVGAFMFMKQNVFKSIKGFDEDYFMYGEDIDLSYKSIKQGFDNYYYGKTTAIHYKGESTLRDKSYAKRFYKAMQIFYRKHFKVNVICDAFVWVGIVIAYNFRRKQKQLLKNVNDYYLLSNTNNKVLQEKLGKTVKLVSHIYGASGNSEIIFDANALTYKEIIEQLSHKDRNEALTFKILPKNSHYIIGSNNAFSRGEVIVFEDN